MSPKKTATLTHRQEQQLKEWKTVATAFRARPLFVPPPASPRPLQPTDASSQRRDGCTHRRVV